MKLSIIIPTYNRADLITRALESVQAGSLSNGANEVEIIVVDDGDDDTEDKVRMFEQNHPEIKVVYLHRTSKKGVNSARNEGVRRASSGWVSFLDSDDEYVPGGLEIIFRTLPTMSKEISVVAFMTEREVDRVMMPRGYLISEKWSAYKPSYEEVLLKTGLTGDVHYCYRRAIFSDYFCFPEDIQGFESSFCARLARHGFSFLYINKIVDRRYTGSYEHLGAYEKWPAQYAKHFKLFIKENEEALKKYPKKYAYFCRSAASSSFRAGDLSSIYWFFKYIFIILYFIL